MSRITPFHIVPNAFDRVERKPLVEAAEDIAVPVTTCFPHLEEIGDNDDRVMLEVRIICRLELASLFASFGTAR